MSLSTHPTGLQKSGLLNSVVSKLKDVIVVWR
jgi:hypothetical protein